MTAPFPQDETLAAVALLREQVAGLLSRIDSSAKPRPDVITPPGARHPGPQWHPADRWTVRCITDDETGPVCVFVTTPEHYGGDFDSIRTGDARKLAMALLAAADWADGLAAGVPQLDAHRTDPLSQPTQPKGTSR